MDRKRLSRRRVVSSFGRIVDSFGLRAPTMLSIKSLLQKLVRTRLEWIRPPREDLGKEPATAVQQEIKLERHDDPELHSLPPCKRLKKDRRHTTLTVEAYVCLTRTTLSTGPTHRARC